MFRIDLETGTSDAKRFRIRLIGEGVLTGDDHMGVYPYALARDLPRYVERCV
jgi:hypothetical protein